MTVETKTENVLVQKELVVYFGSKKLSPLHEYRKNVAWSITRILLWYRLFTCGTRIFCEAGCSVRHTKKTSRPFTGSETVERIRESVTRSPRKSTWRGWNMLGAVQNWMSVASLAWREWKVASFHGEDNYLFSHPTVCPRSSVEKHMFSARQGSSSLPWRRVQVSQHTFPKSVGRPNLSDAMATSIPRFNTATLFLMGNY
jgi:hypothetical protein